MSAVDPAAEAGAAVAVSVTVDGEEAGTDRLISVETWHEANRIPRARLVLFEGPDDDGKSFPLSSSESFLPGKTVVIAAGYGAASKTLHTGVIIRHSIRIAPGESPQLVVETADKLLAMTLGRNSTVSTSKSDKDAIAALVAAAGGSVGRNQAASELPVPACRVKLSGRTSA